jgi:hypothetical protein
MTPRLATTGQTFTGTLTRDALGLLRFALVHGAYRSDFDLAYLLTAGWEVIEATTEERQQLRAAGLWRHLVH